ncbi:SGF29 tudor-like domain-containing protein [Crucibulum laeve]|uniref:SGF29 tudor-like domain-containing protein n=1 Tax=Crucibulum laeve TaxID=68775 RepID=A0A5C3M5F9_9AGAR|nr:SGF29 tudor-like domain-containing protein [Crucibulum laeve]
MDRRRGIPPRPASSEEVACWSHAAESLKTLSDILAHAPTADIIGRVNRLISGWPTDDIVPAEGYESVKKNCKRLTNGLDDLEKEAKEEVKAIEDAIERIGVLIALRKAPEAPAPEKRNKRPRATSPSGTPIPMTQTQPNSRSVSITLPARTSSVGPALLPFSRDAKSRRDTLARQPTLQHNRKVAFHPPADKAANGVSGDADENTWIMAVVIRCLNPEKHKYEVQDPEPQEDGQMGATYIATPKNLIPLPDPNAPIGSSAHLGSYPEFPVGSTVLGLYPDTSCFYRAEVVATPKDTKDMHTRALPSSKYQPTYKLKFEDDDNQEHSVPAHFVVEMPIGG